MADTADVQLVQPPTRVIETERLRLRTVQMKDADVLWPIISNPATMLMTRGVVTSRNLAETWLSARALGHGVFQFLVMLKDARSEDGQEVVVGILGSYHWPSVGYIFHTDHTGKGYATEALLAFIPAFFSHMPPAEQEGGAGYDFIEAKTDVGNIGSRKVLEKAGFTACELIENEFEHATIGWRSTLVFRIARPGKTLDGLGLVAEEAGGVEEGGFMPPVQ